MNEEIKVSELDLADEIRDTDQIMIVQGGANKKATGKMINDRTISDSYDTSEEKGYSQSYQNEHNIIVSPTTPPTSERVWFKQGKNLFNKNTVLRKTGINSSGNLVQNNNYFTSELIKVNSNTDYYVVGAAVVYGYSNSGSYIGMLKETLSAGTFNTGEAIYIRLRNWWATDDTQMEEQINATMLNIGTTGLPYEEYITPSIYVDNIEFYSQEFINEYTLYDNPTGTNSNITLSDNYTNYKYLDIYGQRYGRASYTRIPTTRSQFTLEISKVVDGVFHYYLYEGSLSGKTLTNLGTNHISIGSSIFAIGSDTNIVITKVVGYK